jgi:hypothetical protein
MFTPVWLEESRPLALSANFGSSYGLQSFLGRKVAEKWLFGRCDARDLANKASGREVQARQVTVVGFAN